MKSLLEIYRQGMGPHSTLNLVPYQACIDAAKEVRLKRIKVNHVQVHLYNEYARLEKQAGIAQDIAAAFAVSNFKFVITTDKPCPPAVKDEPYVFDIVVYGSPTEALYRHRVIATGGGGYRFGKSTEPEGLPFDTFKEVQAWFKANPKKTYLDFALQGNTREEIEATFYKGFNLAEIALRRGLSKYGELNVPDKEIHYLRRARSIWLHDENFLSDAENRNRVISAYAYAIGEQICEKAIVVSAPTLCTTPVVWAIALYLVNECNVPSEKLLQGLCASYIFASLVDSGASLASVKVGCQGPMGTACGMAAVMTAVALYDADIDECGRAFGMALEHSLGIICGATTSLPIIPCIQRCSAFATRAYEIAVLNHCIMSTPELCRVDDLIAVLNDTGSDLIAKNKRLGVGGFLEHAPYSLKKPTPKDWE